MRVLFTNTALREVGGTELMVRDAAAGLLRRGGYVPMVFSPSLGEFAEQLKRLQIEIVDDLADLSATPDVIYGHHFMETMMAIQFFPETPALFHCHGLIPWEETPPVHPRICLYIAIGDRTAKKIQTAIGESGPEIRIILNYVDLSRFQPKMGGPPSSLKSAVIYNRYISAEQTQVLRNSCHDVGVECRSFADLNPPVSRPEEVLRNYDVVFAVGKSAMEALATGCAVILCSDSGIGELVREDNLTYWQKRNFSAVTDAKPLTGERVRAEIGQYQVEGQRKVTEQVRHNHSMDRFLNELEKAVQETRQVFDESKAEDPGERLAVYRHLLEAKKILTSLGVEAYHAKRHAADRMMEYRRLECELNATRIRLAELENSMIMRTYRGCVALPVVGRGIDGILRFARKLFPGAHRA